MPLCITDEEIESLRCSHDNTVTSIVSNANSLFTDLQRQLETAKAQTEASSITAEQTCSLLEQKYISLSSDFEKLESQNAELKAAIERNLEELAVVKSEKHRIQLESIEKDGRIEKLSAEASKVHKFKRQLVSLCAEVYEIHKSDRRQLLGMIEQKDTEITEKNTTIKSCLDKMIEKDGMIEMLSAEVSEVHKSKRQLLGMIEQKDTEITEKNTTIKSCLDKIALACVQVQQKRN